MTVVLSVCVVVLSKVNVVEEITQQAVLVEVSVVVLVTVFVVVTVLWVEVAAGALAVEIGLNARMIIAMSPIAKKIFEFNPKTPY